MEKIFPLYYEDIDCYVKIYRNILDKDRLKRLYKISAEHCTERYPITVYGKDTVQPRTNCVFADIAKMGTIVKYSGAALPVNDWHSDIQQLCYDLSTPNFFPDMCLVNGYISLTDNVGAHRDKDLCDELKAVCTVSLGGTRRMIFRPHKSTPCSIELPKMIELELQHGDILYMFGNTNKYFTHEIAKYRKTKDNFEFGHRYSLTFRQQKGGKAFSK